MDLFAGTAEYYDEFRPGLPEEVVDLVLSKVSTPISLLDLGCGTGRITEQFAAHFHETIAVDAGNDMVKLARKRLAKYPVKVLHARAEDVELPKDWRASLVLICRALHWMDQKTILRQLEPIVAQKSVIAILSDNSFWHLDNRTPWSEAVRDTLHRYLGPERRTLLGNYQPPEEFFGKNFVSPIFTELERHTIPVTREWTADQILGYLYSTSFASHAVLGDKAAAFEKELRQRLDQCSPNGIFIEYNHFGILFARRPSMYTV